MIPAALLACATNVAPITLEAIVQVESGGNSLSVNVNHLAGPQPQPRQDGQDRQVPQAQGGANKDGGSATLTTEQRTRVRQTVLAGGNVPRVTNVNFALTVGTSVPTTVRVVEVSPVLVEIHPE